jgi:hypothetical protein
LSQQIEGKNSTSSTASTHTKNALNLTTVSTNFYNQQGNIQDDSLISAPQDSLDFSMNARTLQQPFSSPGDLGGNNEGGRDETYDRSSSSFPNHHHQISLFNDQIIDNSHDAINATTTSLVDVTDRDYNSNINSSYASIKPVDRKQQEERGQKQQQQLAPMSAAAQYKLAVKKSQKSVGGVTSTSSPSSSSSSSALSTLNSNSLMGPQRPTSSKKLPQKKVY